MHNEFLAYLIMITCSIIVLAIYIICTTGLNHYTYIALELSEWLCTSYLPVVFIIFTGKVIEAFFTEGHKSISATVKIKHCNAAKHYPFAQLSAVLLNIDHVTLLGYT